MWGETVGWNNHAGVEQVRSRLEGRRFAGKVEKHEFLGGA